MRLFSYHYDDFMCNRGLGFLSGSKGFRLPRAVHASSAVYGETGASYTVENKAKPVGNAAPIAHPGSRRVGCKVFSVQPETHSFAACLVGLLGYFVFGACL